MKISLLQSTAIVVCFAGPVFSAENSNPEALAAHHSARAVRYVSRPFHAQGPGTDVSGMIGAVATLPLWQANSGVYTYQMVGANPMIAGSNSTTTVPANVIPVKLTFADGTTLDPGASDACSPHASAQSLVLSSPLFNSYSYSPGGVNSGSTQYTDFFQRANFWQYTGPSGINPNYHLLLAAQPVATVDITVPAGDGQTIAAGCGRLGEMDINWFDNYLDTIVIPQLAGQGVMPSTVPAFILYDTVMYDTTASNCCIIGYHSALYSPNFSNALQTYVVADFDRSGEFGNTQDVAALSHEIGEWMDDPTGNNQTPAWGNVGQVYGCQSDLEVGDPLSGTEIAIVMPNAFNYHVQEMAFKSWFYRDAPSTGVNGWYSSNGTFTGPSKPCNSSVTNLSINPSTIAAGALANVKVTVNPAPLFNGIPSGQVTLNSSRNQAVLATLPLSNGSATGLIAFPAGSYSVTANYAGDDNFSGSSSPAVAITVGSPAINLNPVSLSFANENTGTTSAAQNVTLTNQGTASITISSVSFIGLNPTDFNQTNNCGSTVAPGVACIIAIKFAPSAAGNRTALLNVADNVMGSPQAVPVAGIGVSPVSGPQVSVSANSITFPATLAGGASAAQSVTLTNTGNATLMFNSFRILGNFQDFSYSTNCWPSVAAGASCVVSYTFRPGAPGVWTATQNLGTNAPNSPQQITLNGTGTSPAPASKLSVDSNNIFYSDTTVGATSGFQSVTISNGSAATITGIVLSVSGDYSGHTSCGSTLAATGTCYMWLQFAPLATGPRPGQLSIVSDGAGPQIVALIGNGIAASVAPQP